MAFMGVVEGVYVQTMDLACLLWSSRQCLRPLHLTLNLSEALMFSKAGFQGEFRAPFTFLNPLNFYLPLDTRLT